MSNTDERLAELERRLAEAEEEIRILRARIATLESSITERIQAAAPVIAELAFSPLLREMADLTARMSLWSADLKAVEERQNAEARRITALFEERANELSTAALLDIYEQRIEPTTGQSLKEWLKANKADQRYRAVVALRSRRQKSS